MRNFFQTWPVFLVLVPIFFLLHLLTDYFRVLSFHQLWISETFWYLSVSIVLFIIFCTRKPIMRRLALLAFMFQFFFFFFGPLHGFVTELAPALSKYSVLVLMIGITLTGVAIFLWRAKQPFYNVYRYLNTLFFVFIAYELLLIGLLYWTDGGIRRLTKTYPVSDNYKTCDTCQKPDIYLLVFDMYANRSVLQSFWGYDNTNLHNFLDSSGFHTVKNSRSNYNYTVFSMGSILNMDFPTTQMDYTNAFRSSAQLSKFEDNELFRILKKENYSFYNYSWFYFNEAPARVAPFVLTDPKELIAAQTFWYRFKSDIAWNFKALHKPKSVEEKLTPFFVKECEDNLSRVRDGYTGIKQLSAAKNDKPVFAYAHFLIPHGPFLFDSTGKIRPKEQWLSVDHAYYLDQLKYTNTIIKDLCTSLIKEAKRPRIVIVMSDHGYRNFNSKDNLTRDAEFKNLSAFYFPDKRYGMLYDSMSSVNTFRLVLNEYFNYKVPFLRDTSYFMKIK